MGVLDNERKVETLMASIAEPVSIKQATGWLLIMAVISMEGGVTSLWISAEHAVVVSLTGCGSNLEDVGLGLPSS